jgi:predicted component of type VI protein secretion system
MATAAPVQNTVTLALAAGESANPTATFSTAMAARMVTLGSGANAHWKIRAVGVEPLHAEAYWDGASLWIRNGGSVGGTYVNGARADDWVQVFDGAEITLGHAKIQAKASGPGARNPSGTDPRITAASAGYIGEEESTMVFSNAKLASTPSIPPPVTPKAPAVAAPPPRTANGRAGTLAPPAPTALAAGTAPIAPSQPPVASPSASPSNPPAEADPPKPGAGEATVIRPSPYAALLEGNASLGPLPAAGNRNPMPAGPHTLAPGAVNVGAPSSVLVSPSAVSLPVVAPARVGTMGGLQVLQPVQAVGQATTGMSQPGTSQPGAWGDDPFGPMDIPPPPTQAPEKTVAGTSPRTLVLGGITLVIGLIAAILPPPQPQHGRGNAPTTEVLTRGAPPPASNNILQLPISPPGLVGVILPAPMGGTDAQGRPRALPPPNPSDPIKLAAEAVAANRYADAVVLYERLAVEYPEAPLFRQFATILRQRLATMNCSPGAPGCIPPPPPAVPSRTP